MFQSVVRAVMVLLVASLVLGLDPSAARASQDMAASQVNVEIIVDASGSMAGETDTGELRMDAAKRILNEVVGAIPVADGINVGLRVYGHEGDNTNEGKAESCAASELVVPIDGVATEELLTQIDAFEPTGWTPLGLSLEEATADMEAVAESGSTSAIILVTDGIETCEGDPAGAAGDALAGDAGIVTNVIGFATEPEDLTNLEAISEAGSGELLSANNAGQLITALFTVLEELEVVEEGGTGEARDSAVGIGRVGQVGNYDVTVVSVTQDATDLVMTENEFNDPPADGKQFFIARVAVTYTGSESGLPASELNFQAVGDANAAYATFTDTCGVIPDDSYLVSDLFEDGSAEFNVCWAIDSEDADSLVMYVESYLDFDADPVWFSLGNSAPPVERSARPDDDASTPVDDSEESEEDTTTPSTPERDANEERDEASSGDGSERDQSIAVGSPGPIGDYEVTVVSVTADATDFVMTENQFNDPPADGKRFFIARVEVVYTGGASGMPASELNFQTVGDANAAYATFTDTCGVIPDDSYLVSDLFEGGSVEFNVCWAIDSEDADSLVMYVESYLDFSADPVWFSLEE